MTIKRGASWGEPGPLPADGVVVRSDAEAADVVTAALREGRPAPTLGLLGGDLCRTMGGAGDETRLRSADAMTFPVDLGTVAIDGVQHWFVAHLVVRTRGWGTATVVMNAQWLGSWNMAPKAHPNDGVVDVLIASLSVVDRLKARGRLPLGIHLPHPRITTHRASTLTVGHTRHAHVWLDSRRIAASAALEITVVPDAIRVVI